MAKSKELQIAQGQEAMMQDAASKLQEIRAIEDQTKAMEQESLNRAHDEEFFQSRNEEKLEIITEKEINEAYQTLLKYRQDKAGLEKKILENEEFWKLNHWDCVGETDNKRVRPKSAWLFNTIINKHADAMDNYPEANILPRAKDDEEVAKILSDVIPVILEQNNYEDTYSDCQWYKCKNGTSAQGVFWNNDRNNGLGDVEIKKIDLLNLFWKAGISDIQESPNVFHVAMVDNDELNNIYPDLKTGNADAVGLSSVEGYHISSDASEQSAVIDWYYKKRVTVQDSFGLPKTNTVLHYCKFCNGQIIYASENDTKFTDRGWYDHGLYPFVLDTLFPMEKTVTGMGYIDIEKDDQLYIDKLQQAILESAIVNARPRAFIRDDGSVNEEEYLDISNPLIHVQGGLGEDSIRPVPNTAFNKIYESVLMQKISEMKDTSGNTASSQGQTSSVTSASGIASLQEAAGKLSRDANSASYRAYKKVVYMVIELIRQFYDAPRCFRITGEMGRDEFITFDNSGLIPQSQGEALGISLGERLPIVDIKVVTQKKNAYTKEAQNQTALNLYNMGFFAPQNSDAALSCLDMMNFDDIQKVRDNVEKNGQLYQMVMQLQMQLQAATQELMKLKNPGKESNLRQIQTQQQPVEVSDSAPHANIQQSNGSLSTQAASATRGSTAPR